MKIIENYENIKAMIAIDHKKINHRKYQLINDGCNS